MTARPGPRRAAHKDHRSYYRDHEQRGGHFKRQEIAGENGLTKFLDVFTWPRQRAGSGLGSGGPKGSSGEHQQLDHHRQARQYAYWGHGPKPLAAEGFFAVHAQEHYHEKEQDHDGTGVDDDLHCGQEVRSLVYEEQGYPEQSGNQRKGAVDGVAQEHHAEGAGRGQRCTNAVDRPSGGVGQPGNC
jgi:hypothetical protein